MGPGWMVRVDPGSAAAATRMSPALGVREAAVGLPEPDAVEVVSTPAIPATSETSICPVALAPRVAVTAVDPDVPVEANPAQISAVPPPDVPKPVTGCQVTPPPVTAVARKPAPLVVDEVRMVATSPSPAVTPWGRVTNHDDEDWAPEVSWTGLGDHRRAPRRGSPW